MPSAPLVPGPTKTLIFLSFFLSSLVIDLSNASLAFLTKKNLSFFEENFFSMGITDLSDGSGANVRANINQYFRLFILRLNILFIVLPNTSSSKLSFLL